MTVLRRGKKGWLFDGNSWKTKFCKFLVASFSRAREKDSALPKPEFSAWEHSVYPLPAHSIKERGFKKLRLCSYCRLSSIRLAILPRFSLETVFFCFLIALAAFPRLALGGIPTGYIELQFRSHVEVAAPLVKVGDLAEVRASSPEEARWVKQLELFPAPRSGRGRVVTRQEILETLLRRGFSRRQLLVSGVPQTFVVGTGEHDRGNSYPVAKKEERGIPQSTAKQGGQRSPEEFGLRGEQDQTPVPGRVHNSLVPAQAFGEKVLLQAGGDNFESQNDSVRNTTFPGQGRSALALSSGDLPGGLRTSGGNPSEDPQNPAAPPIWDGKNLAISPQTGNPGRLNMLSPIKQVWGEQEPIRANSPLAADSQPQVQPTAFPARNETAAGAFRHFPSRNRGDQLVNRGDVVTVWVRGPNVQVRTTGKARQDGRLGDSVLIEAPGQRGVYSARVCGPRTVEIVIQPESAR
mgnify:CR=1 FL=1